MFIIKILLFIIVYIFTAFQYTLYLHSEVLIKYKENKLNYRTAEDPESIQKTYKSQFHKSISIHKNIDAAKTADVHVLCLATQFSSAGKNNNIKLLIKYSLKLQIEF